MRVTDKQLNGQTETINNLLGKLNRSNRFWLSFQYGKVFIYHDQGECVRGGLSKREAYDILYSIGHTLYMLTDNR
jgi:hypothetical protein